MMQVWNLRLWLAIYLPSFLAKKKMIAWLYALLKPLEWLHVAFISYRTEINESLLYNSQSMLLEYHLNSRFDPENRRMRVVNQELIFLPRYHYFQGETGTIYFYFGKTEAHSPHFFYAINERDAAMYSFLVSFPASMIVDRNAVRAAVNFRKFAGVRYKLVKVEDDLITPIEFLTQEYE